VAGQRELQNVIERSVIVCESRRSRWIRAGARVVPARGSRLRSDRSRRDDPLDRSSATRSCARCSRTGSADPMARLHCSGSSARRQARMQCSASRAPWHLERRSGARGSIVAAIRALACSVLLVACGRASRRPGSAEVLVVVAQRDVPVVIEWLGTVEASSTPTSARGRRLPDLARLSGGSLVKLGAAVQTDPRRSGGARTARRATSARRVALELARLDMKRYTPLVAQARSAGRSTTPRRSTSARARRWCRPARGGREGEDRPRLTEIRSPIDGIVGWRSDSSAISSDRTIPPLDRLADRSVRVSFRSASSSTCSLLPAHREAVRASGFPGGRGAADPRRWSVYPYRGTGHPAGREVDPRTGTSGEGRARTPTPCCAPAVRGCASRWTW
jgi:hypothetical protein